MLKSELLRLAQQAVVESEKMEVAIKLDVLRVLMEEEYVQKICEKSAEANKKESEVD